MGRLILVLGCLGLACTTAPAPRTAARHSVSPPRPTSAPAAERLTKPTELGIELLPEEQQSKMTLVLHMPQQTYRFVPDPRP